MNNRLAALPASTGRLAALKKLDLMGNRLAALPETIGQLKQLKISRVLQGITA